MKTIQAYETSDGKLFACHRDAKSHQEDIIGEMLDNLIPNDTRGNITRTDRHNILCQMIADKELAKKITALYSALRHSEEAQE